MDFDTFKEDLAKAVKDRLELIFDMELSMHYFQPLFSIKRFCHHAKTLEVVEKVNFDMVKPWLCHLDGLSVNAKSKVLGLSKAIVTCLHLMEQHVAVLVTDVVVAIIGAFLITFAAVAVGMALEGIGDKVSEILAS